MTKVRNATTIDLDQLVQVEQESWGDICESNDLITLEMFEKYLAIIPKTLFVAEDNEERKLLGYACEIRLNLAFDQLQYSSKSWRELSSNGWLTKHEPKGNAFFVVSIGVIKDATNRGVGTLLLQALKDQVIKDSGEYLFLGSRLPGLDTYLKHEPNGTAEKYITMKREDGKRYDPELRFYSDLEILKLIPNYFTDPASRDYGVLMYWRNPYYRAI